MVYIVTSSECQIKIQGLQSVGGADVVIEWNVQILPADEPEVAVFDWNPENLAQEVQVGWKIAIDMNPTGFVFSGVFEKVGETADWEPLSTTGGTCLQMVPMEGEVSGSTSMMVYTVTSSECQLKISAMQGTPPTPIEWIVTIKPAEDALVVFDWNVDNLEREIKVGQKIALDMNPDELTFSGIMEQVGENADWELIPSTGGTCF
jgi:hypothetical protein